MKHLLTKLRLRYVLPFLIIAVIGTLPAALTESKYVWQESISATLQINYTAPDSDSLSDQASTGQTTDQAPTLTPPEENTDDAATATTTPSPAPNVPNDSTSDDPAINPNAAPSSPSSGSESTVPPISDASAEQTAADPAPAPETPHNNN